MAPGSLRIPEWVSEDVPDDFGAAGEADVNGTSRYVVVSEPSCQENASLRGSVARSTNVLPRTGTREYTTAI